MQQKLISILYLYKKSIAALSVREARQVLFLTNGQTVIQRGKGKKITDHWQGDSVFVCMCVNSHVFVLICIRMHINAHAHMLLFSFT